MTLSYHCVSGTSELLPPWRLPPFCLTTRLPPLLLVFPFNTAPWYPLSSQLMIYTLSSATTPLCLQLRSTPLVILSEQIWSFRRGTKLILFNNRAPIILFYPVCFGLFFLSLSRPPLLFSQSLINEFKGASIWVLRSGCSVHMQAHTHTHTHTHTNKHTSQD